MTAETEAEDEAEAEDKEEAEAEEEEEEEAEDAKIGEHIRTSCALGDWFFF